MFFDEFKLAVIPDEITAKMLESVKKRLQLIDKYGGSCFVIARRVTDDMICKSAITENNKQEVETLLW